MKKIIIIQNYDCVNKGLPECEVGCCFNGIFLMSVLSKIIALLSQSVLSSTIVSSLDLLSLKFSLSIADSSVSSNNFKIIN